MLIGILITTTVLIIVYVISSSHFGKKEITEELDEIKDKLDFVCEKLGYDKVETVSFFQENRYLTKWDKLLEYLKIEWKDSETISGYKKLNK